MILSDELRRHRELLDSVIPRWAETLTLEGALAMQVSDALSPLKCREHDSSPRYAACDLRLYTCRYMKFRAVILDELGLTHSHLFIRYTDGMPLECEDLVFDTTGRCIAVKPRILPHRPPAPWLPAGDCEALSAETRLLLECRRWFDYVELSCLDKWHLTLCVRQQGDWVWIRFSGLTGRVIPLVLYKQLQNRLDRASMLDDLAFPETAWASAEKEIRATLGKRSVLQTLFDDQKPVSA